MGTPSGDDHLRWADALLAQIMREPGRTLGVDVSTTNKLTRVFPKGARMSQRYFGDVINGKHQRVRFCWSIERNAAGYFLTWRETHWADGSGGKRDQWSARRKRNAAKALALKRYERARQKQQ